LWLLRGGVNQTRIRRRILRLKILDRFKVGGIGYDFGKFLQLLELIRFRFSFFLFSNSCAHNISSPFSNVCPNQGSTNDKVSGRTSPFLVRWRKRERMSDVLRGNSGPRFSRAP